MGKTKKLLVYLPPLDSNYGSMYEYTAFLVEVGLSIGYNSVKVVCDLDKNPFPKEVEIIRPMLKSRGLRKALLLFLDAVKFNFYSASYDFVFVSQEYVLPLYRKKTLVIFHDLTQIIHPRNIFSKNIVLLSVLICKFNNSKIIVPSSATQENLKSLGLESTLIENHFDIKGIYFSNIMKFEKINIIWVGTNDPHKRLNYVLNAAKEIPWVNFILVVDKSPVAGSVASNVSVFTSVDPSLLSVLFLQSQIYLSTSKDEGFGRPLHEALAYGLQVVVSDIPAYSFISKERKFTSYTKMLERIRFFASVVSRQEQNTTIKFKGYSNKEDILSKYKNEWI